MKHAFLFVLLMIILTSANGKVYDIRDYGAKGDGKTLDTTAIEKAFKAAKDADGGIVLVPAGKYLTGLFNLTSNTTLKLEKDGIILGAQDKSQYPIIEPLPSYGSSRDGYHARYQPLIYGYSLTNVKIEGEGVIDGQGKYWWDLRLENKLTAGRPRLVEPLFVNGLEISGVTLKNSGFWTLHPTYCKNVHMHDITVSNPHDNSAPNTDGIDPDSCENVMIERVHVSVGDDHIAIKSGFNDPGLLFNMPCKNVTVRDSDFYQGDGISIGSETSGGIMDVLVYNCTVHSVVDFPAFKGIYIKTGRPRGNIIENIVYRDITIDFVTDVIALDMTWGGQPPTHNKTTTPIVKNISFHNIKGLGARAGRFNCLDDSPCTGITIDNVEVKDVHDWTCNAAHGNSKDVSPPVTCLLPEN